MKNFSKTLSALLVVFMINYSNSQCDAPLNLSVTYSNITNESTFTWDPVASATEYRFQIKFQWDTWTNVDAPLQDWTTTNSYSVTGLATSFPFDWRVSAICTNVESAFSPTQNYTSPCPLPNGLSVSNVTTSGAVLNWNTFPGYSHYTAAFAVSYRILNSGAPWTYYGQVSDFTMNISGLQSNTTYEWCVNTVCSYFNSAPVIGQFTTLTSCNLLPVNLRSTSTTHNQNRINWNSVAGAVGYTYQYKKNSDTNWITGNTNSTNYKITNLDEETLYDWRVRANCSNGSGSYTSTEQFHTYSSFCKSYGVNTNEWIDLFSLGSISRSSGQDVQGYFNSSQSTNLVIGSTNNSGQLSAGFNGNSTYTERFVIYIDFNRNGNFNDSGERVLAPFTTTNGNIYNFNIAIPGNVTPGPTKLKVVMRRGGGNNSPCAQGVRGEVEDYVVNLVTSNSNRDIVDTENSANLDLEAENRNVVNDEIRITPNPSNGIFQIQTKETNSDWSYKIYSSTGHLISENKLSVTPNHAIDLSDQVSGLYYMMLNQPDGERKVIRLIKL